MTTKHDTLSIDMIERAARILKSLGHPTRLAIVEILYNDEKNVTDIQTALGLPQAVTSQHLRFMERRDILKSRREGVQVFYRLKDEFITQILECVQRCAQKL